MVTIARRFHYKSIRQSVPSDLPFLKLRLDETDFEGFWKPLELEELARADAPLARHHDAHKLHEFLCYRIAHFMPTGPEEQEPVTDSNAAIWIMFYMVKLDMPELSGGVSKIIWDEYVYCVLHALIVWGAYCTRVQILTCSDVVDEDVSPAP